MSVLVAYEGKRGSTEAIAGRIADRLRARGEHVDLGQASAIKDVTGYQGVVVGSAVYFGSWVKDATEFMRRHETALSERPTWLFSSGPVGDTVLPGPKGLAALEAAVHPRNHRIFRGAIDPKKLSCGERLAVKAVKAPPGDFRDWAEIDAWADSIAEGLAATRLAASAAAARSLDRRPSMSRG